MQLCSHWCDEYLTVVTIPIRLKSRLHVTELVRVAELLVNSFVYKLGSEVTRSQVKVYLTHYRLCLQICL
jgi:hypothetical protein